MLGKYRRPETITVKFRFSDAPGVFEKVINVVAFTARGLICSNLKSTGTTAGEGCSRNSIYGTFTTLPSRHENQEGFIVIVGRRTFKIHTHV